MGAVSARGRGPWHAAPTWSIGSRANKGPTARAALIFFRQRNALHSGISAISSAAIDSEKKALRATMADRRAQAAQAAPKAGVDAADQLIAALARFDGPVALYQPIKSELDTTPLVDALAARRVALALPVVISAHEPLIFRAYAPGDPLIDGAYGAKIPAPNARQTRPWLIIAPLLAFTRQGARLGYGGGYYDRTIAQLRTDGAPLIVAGYGYSAQEVDALPTSPLDQSLDWMITERKAIRCG